MEQNASQPLYISEQQYEHVMKREVETLLHDIKHTGYLQVNHDISIYYETYRVESPKAAIVISHGFCESIEKYKELIFYFIKNNFNVYGLDHRGHGHSTHLGKDFSQVHVESFDDYIHDFKNFMDNIVKNETKELPLYLFAHSMGGAIGTRFLQLHPEYFQRAVLNAPMLEINFGKYPAIVAHTLAFLSCMVGLKKSYVLGHGPFTGEPNVEASGTSSRSRYKYYHQKRLQEEKLQTDGGSFGWLRASIRATKQIAQDVHHIKIPVLLFQSELDTFVKSEGQNDAIEKIDHGVKCLVENGKHELYFERDELLHPYLTKLLSWFNEEHYKY